MNKRSLAGERGERELEARMSLTERRRRKSRRKKMRKEEKEEKETVEE